MYIPKHFEVTDEEEVFAFIEANSFGQLISNVNGRLFSTHLPFLVIREGNKLLGHLARQNPQHAELENQEILITFQGPHDYISPSWYSRPGVPTWNYQAVHIYGRCKVLHEPDQLANIVNTLTKKHESVFAEPWEPEYKSAMLSAIVGLELTITEIQCKYKLSQNRSERDQKQVKEKLHMLGSQTLSEAMQEK